MPGYALYFGRGVDLGWTSYGLQKLDPGPKFIFQRGLWDHIQKFDVSMYLCIYLSVYLSIYLLYNLTVLPACAPLGMSFMAKNVERFSLLLVSLLYN